MIDAATNSWIQNVPAIGPRNLAAYAGNNHVFVPIPSGGIDVFAYPEK